MEEMYNAKTAAMNFVQEVCKVRAKGNLPDFMNICIGVMNEYKVIMCAVPPPFLACAHQELAVLPTQYVGNV